MLIVSDCFYCEQPWDKYQPCSSPHCHQLVLSCQECRGQGSTACCHLCKEIAERSKVEGQRPKEECECTHGRVRIPHETFNSETEMHHDRGQSGDNFKLKSQGNLQQDKEIESNFDERWQLKLSLEWHCFKLFKQLQTNSCFPKLEIYTLIPSVAF